MTKQVFLWETASGSQERIEWLKANYNKPVTLEEYSAMEQSVPHNHKRPSRCKSPSGCRAHYNKLKAKFGFFTADARAE